MKTKSPAARIQPPTKANKLTHTWRRVRPSATACAALLLVAGALSAQTTSAQDTGNQDAVKVDADGNLDVIGAVTANRFKGNGGELTQLNANNITEGTLQPARVPGLNASKITSGVLNDARLSDNVVRQSKQPTFNAGLRLNSNGKFEIDAPNIVGGRFSVGDVSTSIGSKNFSAGLNVWGGINAGKDVHVQRQLFVYGALNVLQPASSKGNTYAGKWFRILRYEKDAEWAVARSVPPPLPSDRRLKSDLQSIPSAADKVRKLRGVTYRWNEDGKRHFTRDIETTITAGPDATAEENEQLWKVKRSERYEELGNIQVGVVAQDVEAVLPEAVTTDEAGYKSVRYQYLIPLLIEASKEQEKTVRDQARVVAQQQQEIAQLTAANLAVRQQLRDLVVVKARLERVEASLQRAAAAEDLGDSVAVARLLESRAH